MASETASWAERHGRPLRAHQRSHANERDPERPLRVGYLSSNFLGHCQSFFTLPLLEQHDRSKFTIFGYSAAPRIDAATARIRAQCDQWRDVSRLEPPAAAELIRADGIDVLVDLTMHMAVSQLRTFACKPAPVQLAWLAYPGTTGLPEIDYRLTDPHLDPPGAPHAEYSEASLTLADTFWCYNPLTSEPEISSLPALETGYIRFGCLNAFWKLNATTFEHWAALMSALPASRLTLLAPEGSARQGVQRIFTNCGVDAARIDFVPRRPRPEYLASYRSIDICLDSLPYNGHTTSLDAFWMGVPVLTVVGQTVVGRAGLCQAMNLGLPQLVAQGREEFVRAGVALATDLKALADLRATLRACMQASPLMDAPRFARSFEHALREAWRAWCRSP
jgi:predicted O-linked N-acetylglucosamine transferase (SPINDLY family)